MPGIVLLILRFMLALFLYAFLFWAFITIWQDLRQQLKWRSSPQIPIIRLASSTFQDGKQTAFSIEQIIIGRNPSCDYVIEDSTVSAMHAQVFFRHNQWWVEDLNSTNGTFLNDQKVTIATVITSGDKLLCGDIPISIQIGTTKPIDLENG